MKNNHTIDAFGRLRISEPRAVFSSKQTVDTQPLFWDDAEVSGSGTSSTYLTNAAATRIAVSNTTAGKRTRQSKKYFNYQPGKSQLVMITGVIGAGGTGITKRLGFFDDRNGLYFEQHDGVMYVCKRSYVTGQAVDTKVPSSEWNIDGEGGVYADVTNIDFTKAHIYWINFEWLGVGSAQFGVVINGEFVPFHQFNHANSSTSVYMGIPNLPIRYEIENSGTGAASSMDCICSTVVSEGGIDIPGVQFGYERTTSLVTLNDADYYPLMAFRLKSTHLHASVTFNSLNILCTSTATYAIKAILNPTVTGTALSFSGITNSCLEVANPTNATKVSGGTDLYALIGQTSATVLVTEKQDISNNLSLGSKIDGTADILVIAVKRVTGTTETFYGAMNWVEIY